MSVAASWSQNSSRGRSAQLELRADTVSLTSYDNLLEVYGSASGPHPLRQIEVVLNDTISFPQLTVERRSCRSGQARDCQYAWGRFPANTRHAAFVVNIDYTFDIAPGPFTIKLKVDDVAGAEATRIMRCVKSTKRSAVTCANVHTRRGRFSGAGSASTQSRLVGYWAQESVLDCDGRFVTVNEVDRIRELIFESDGSFSVTWTPFETYHDYWGSFDINERTRRITIRVRGGNHVPPDIKPTGTYSIDSEGRLVFRGLSLGSKHPTGRPLCGARFVR